MDDVINISEAKAHLSELVDRAAAGEEIVIARGGRPIARIMALADGGKRPVGIAKDWKIPGDLFLQPMDEADLRAAEGADTDEFGITRRNDRQMGK